MAFAGSYSIQTYVQFKLFNERTAPCKLLINKHLHLSQARAMRGIATKVLSIYKNLKRKRPIDTAARNLYITIPMEL